jgi:putative ABC transport system permease protein
VSTSVLARKARRELFGLGVQALSVIAMVACGVALLVASWSSYESLRRARDSFYSRYLFADWFVDLKRAPRDLLSRVRALPGVERVEDRVVLFGRVTRGEAIAMGRLISIPSGPPGTQPALNRIHIRKGRLPESGSARPNEAEVLVHEAFAKAHSLSPGDELRVVIEGREHRMRVVGIGISPETVYALSPRSPFPDDRRFGIFWLPRKELEAWGDLTDSFNSLTLQGAPQSRELSSRLRRMFTPYGARWIQPRSRQISNMFVDDEIRQQRVTAFFYPLIFFGVAAWLLQVVASRWVEVQRPQIAALKSLGYTDGALTLHLLQVILWVVLAGTLLGLMGGVGLGRIFFSSYEDFFRFPAGNGFGISGKGIVLGAVMGMAPGFIGCARSLAQIFRLTPVEAMRPLSPVDFSKSLLRGGLMIRGSIRGRMVARNLLRRPSRLLFSVLGLAVGISITVLSGAWGDILEDLIGMQFFRNEREDVSLFLVHPRPPGVLEEIGAIPGVLSVQGSRVSSALLRFRQHEREVGLIGVAPSQPGAASVRHRIWEPPASGIEIPSTLARLTGAGIGDSVELELLEGKGTRWRETISGINLQPVGNLITLPLERLSRMLDETPSLNLVTLQAERDRWARIQEKLDEFPEVAGAGIKLERLQSFHRTVGKIIRISTLVLGLFSLIISSGVVFNLVRVSFSERSWEMASLRVLGFGNWDVFALLASEVAIQVGLAIVPGALIGWLWISWSSKWIHSESMDFPIIIHPDTYGRGGVIALVALAAALFSCHRRLHSLSPVSALKARE